MTGELRISINVVANYLQIGDMNPATELFLGTGGIWRVCQGLLRISDLTATVEAN